MRLWDPCRRLGSLLFSAEFVVVVFGTYLVKRLVLDPGLNEDKGLGCQTVSRRLLGHDIN